MAACLRILGLMAATIGPIAQGMIVYNPTSYTSRYVDPCSPNPCGSNTQCRVADGRPVCSCLPGHWGNPLTYCQRGECEVNQDCPNSKACRNYKCEDVCAGQCGRNADCTPRNHIAVCSCPARHTGDPSVSCRQMDPQEQCYPSPCGQNTKCEVINDVPVCSCLPGYVGSPFSGCRHECDSDYDCGSTQMCQQYKCTSACGAGTCATTATCEVHNHRPTCSCPKGQLYTAKRSSGRFNRFFANMSQGCLKENHVTAERVTNGNGDYNEQALTKLMKKPRTNETSAGMKNVIEKCEKEDDKDLCEKAVKFTKCIYSHRNEIGVSNNNTSSYRRRPAMIPFGRYPGGAWSIL